MPKTYTVKEVADILGFSTNSIYSFLKEKRIRGVRIGKGRFRIPEEELSRILHLSKKAAVIKTPAAAPEIVQAVQPITAAALKQEGDAVFMERAGSAGSLHDRGLLTPNIFDWFVGLGAVVAGVGLFVFNSSYTTVEFPRMTLIYPVIRLILIGCGFGMLASSLFSQMRGWKHIFQLVLAGMGFFNAYGLIRGGDIEGGALYGALALIVAVANFVPFGGIVSIGLYVSVVAILYPLVMIFFPADAHMAAFSVFLGLPSPVIGFICLIVAIVVLIGFWLGYAGNRKLFVLAAWIMALGAVGAALWYAHLQYWSRAFFMLVVGSFTALLPYWWPLQQQLSRRYKLLLHGLFLSIGIVMILAVLVVYMLQQSVWAAREREVMNKVHLGHSRVRNAAESVQSALVVAASNTDFATAMQAADVASLNKYGKIIYESNSNIRRLVFLNAHGDGVTVYPYGTFDEPNFAYREYFQQAKNVGKPYVSDVFQAKTDQSGRYVVVIAVPIFDAKQQFTGVMTASMDLERIGLRLGEIASEEEGEYFVVVDSKGIILSHPNQKLVGTIVPDTDPLHEALTGQEGIRSGIMIEKMPGMMGYAYIPELRWAISLRIPSAKVFGLTTLDIWIVFGVVSVLIGAGITLISYLRGQTYLSREGGP